MSPNINYCFGDHILGDITPNITFWDFAVGDSLGTYFKSLELVETLPIRYLFSAHRSLVGTSVKGLPNCLFTIGSDYRRREIVCVAMDRQQCAG